jgi:hypothetical protein
MSVHNLDKSTRIKEVPKLGMNLNQNVDQRKDIGTKRFCGKVKKGRAFLTEIQVIYLTWFYFDTISSCYTRKLLFLFVGKWLRLSDH